MDIRLSVYQVSRLMSLVDLAIESDESHIKTHNEYLSSLTENEFSELDDFDLNYSDFLAKDIEFLRELKRSLQQGF